jgi:hypothetical protein
LRFGLVDADPEQAVLVVEMSYIELDLDEAEHAGWVAHGLRRFEDFLLIHAAFALEWPEDPDV